MLRDALAHRSRPMSGTSIAPAVVAAMFILAGGVGGSVACVWHLLPHDGTVANGTRIAGEEVPEGTSPEAWVRRRAKEVLDRSVTFRVAGGPEVTLTLQQLGVRVDEETTLRRAMEVGRRGSLAYRLDESWRARGGKVGVPLSWEIDAEPVVRRVDGIKEELDAPGVPARYDFRANAAVGHRNGRALDAYGALDVLDRVVREGGNVVEVPVVEVPPVVTADFLERLDMSQRVGHYETRFGYLGGQADRAHNIATAASRLDGLVMLPGQVVSFNQVVGHRTLENGFRKGWEIFKGEMVEGVGGGTCQVASTLHAAAYLGGLDVVERSPHSRPSGYIDIGLDATVVDGLVDLKLRNPFTFPVVLRSVVDKGQITFEVLGEQRPVRVTFRGEVVGTQRYKRKVQEAAWLAEGRVVRKQRGIRGYTVRKVRLIRARDGRQRQEETRDVYPPTVEIFLVPPGTDPERDLPPLPHEAEKDPGQEDGGCEGVCEERERPKIENAAPARAAAPQPSLRVVIDR